MPFIPLSDFTLHYEHTGNGKIPVLLLHGNFASWRWWLPSLKLFHQSPYKVYLPEMRGCGDSEYPADGYHISQLAHDLHEFVKTVNTGALHLVAHSLGGAVALQFTLDHPELVNSLLLVDPAPAEGMPHLRKSASSGISINYVLRSLDLNRSMLKRMFKQMIPTLDSDSPLFSSLVNDAERMSPVALEGFLLSLASWSVQGRLHEIQAPTLILLGERDGVVKHDAVERTAAALKQGELLKLPNVGHAPQLEQPDSFNQILFEFLEKQRLDKQTQLSMLERLRGLGGSFHKETWKEWLRKKWNGD